MAGESEVKLAQATFHWPGGINQFIGPMIYADDFGLTLRPEGNVTFGSNTTAQQVMLAGDIDTVSTSLVSGLEMIQQGRSIKYFCPAVNGYTSYLFGVRDVKSLSDIDPATTRVALEPEGGPTNTFMNLVFQKHGLDIRTPDLKNVIILDGASNRQTGLIRGDVDVAIISKKSLPALQEAIGEENVHILADVAADLRDDSIFTAYMATTDWLQEHDDLAARFCASLMKGSKKLSEDFDFFKAVNDKYLSTKAPVEILRTAWEDIRDNELFAQDADGLSERRVKAMIDTSIANGTLDESFASMAYEDVVAVDILNAAMKYLEEDDGDMEDPFY